MSADPIYDLLLDDLLWLRRQRGSFDTRLASARGFIATVGGGSLRAVRNEMTRLRRLHAAEPGSDISAYFATAGYRTPGETLDQRLKVFAGRHFVAEGTASDVATGVPMRWRHCCVMVSGARGPGPMSTAVTKSPLVAM